MRILVVDDEPGRYHRLFESLDKLGIGRDQVDLVSSASDARSNLEENEYDLLILDILIPFRPEDREDPQNAVDLLFAIREGETKFAPRYLLGITADRDGIGEALRQFEDWCWTILNYSAVDDDWINKAANCASFIRDRKNNQADLPQATDVAVVCALSDPEMSEVLKLPWNWTAARPLDDMTFVRDGVIECGDQKFTVAATTLPRMGMVASALRTSSLINHLRPKMIAMTGICAGVRSKTQLGDILFADPAWDFQSGKRKRTENDIELAIRPHQLPASQKVRAHLEQIRDDQSAISTIVGNFDGHPSSMSRVLIGPVASGSQVLADGEMIQEVEKQHQSLLGIEMEIYGLYAAAQEAPHPQPLCFALKGVCDFADTQKEDGHQKFAAYVSAGILRLLLERYGSRLLS